MYSAGDCVLLETDYYEDGKPKAHLFVVILPVKSDSDMTILIPMDSIYDDVYYDPTTLLNKGEHDFVIKPTYMNYYEGRLRTGAWIKLNTVKGYPPVSEEILQKICDGFTNTESIKHDIYDAYLFRKR